MNTHAEWGEQSRQTIAAWWPGSLGASSGFPTPVLSLAVCSVELIICARYFTLPMETEKGGEGMMEKERIRQSSHSSVHQVS